MSERSLRKLRHAFSGRLAGIPYRGVLSSFASGCASRKIVSLSRPITVDRRRSSDNDGRRRPFSRYATWLAFTPSLAASSRCVRRRNSRRSRSTDPKVFFFILLFGSRCPFRDVQSYRSILVSRAHSQIALSLQLD